MALSHSHKDYIDNGSSGLFVCLFVCGISLTSGQLINELFPDCKWSCKLFYAAGAVTASM